MRPIASPRHRPRAPTGRPATLDRFAAREGVLVLDAPLRFVVPLAGPFGAFLLLAMAWLSLTPP